MRRGIGITLASAALVATIGTTTLAAPVRTPFSVKVNATAPGGRLVLQVRERSVKGAFSVKYHASAVVHFGSGDVVTQLSVKKAASLRSTATVPVSVNEVPGTVPIDVTISAGGNNYLVQAAGAIKGR